MSPTPEEGTSRTSLQHPQGQTSGNDEAGTSHHHLSSTTVTTADSNPQPSTPSVSAPPDSMNPVLYNPIPNARYPPPWYRSQTNEPGRPRARAIIAGGLVFSCAEGWAWMERERKLVLNPNHSQDLTILRYLDKAVGIAISPMMLSLRNVGT